MVRRPYFAPDTVHHVVLRGARGMDIMHDDSDWWDCNRLLYFLNDKNRPHNYRRDIAQTEGVFERPVQWPVREPLVAVMAYCLHANHIHLLVKLYEKDGLSRLMHGLPNSMSLRYNKKYGGSGSIFQGGYLARHVSTDADLHNVALYTMAKNVMERYPGGINKAVSSFESAKDWAMTDSFSSFPDYGGTRASPIIEKDMLQRHFSTPNRFFTEVHQYLQHWYVRERELGELALE